MSDCKFDHNSCNALKERTTTKILITQEGGEVPCIGSFHVLKVVTGPEVFLLVRELVEVGNQGRALPRACHLMKERSMSEVDANSDYNFQFLLLLIPIFKFFIPR